jgi:hypothetical protein
LQRAKSPQVLPDTQTLPQSDAQVSLHGELTLLLRHTLCCITTSAAVLSNYTYFSWQHSLRLRIRCRASLGMVCAGEAHDVVGGDCDGQHSMVGMNAAPRKAYRMSDTGVYQQAPPAELEACRVVHEQAELACGGTENGAGTPTSPFPNKPCQAIGMSDRDTAGQYPSSPNMFFTPRLSPRGRASPLGARYMDSPLGHDVPAASDMPQGAAVAEFGADLPMESEQQHSASAQPSTEMGAHAPRNTEQDWTVSSLYSSAAALDPSDIPTKSALKICQVLLPPGKINLCTCTHARARARSYLSSCAYCWLVRLMCGLCYWRSCRPICL